MAARPRSRKRRAQRKRAKGAGANDLQSIERLFAEGRFHDAAAALDKYLTRSPEDTTAWTNLGSLRLELGDPVAAIAALIEALSREPTNVPALSNLALAKAQMGEREEAAGLYRQVLAVEPTDGESFYELANLKRFSKEDPDLAAMETLIATPDLPDTDRMFTHFALGKAYEDTGQYDRSFEHLAAANHIRRSNSPYRVEKDENLVSRIIDAFDPGVIASLTGSGIEDDRPVFVLGMPRSGTTLIEQILASHSQVHGAGELDLFRDLVAGADFAFPGGHGELTAGRLTELGKAYSATLAEMSRDSARITDKMPRNFFFLGLIALALPNAHIIHCRRSPIDTCLSCFAIHFPQGQEFSFDLDDLGRYYRAYDRLMAHWHELFPGRIHDVHYESVIADLETETRRLLNFCGLPWEDGCLSFHETRRPVTTASNAQVRQPLYKSAVKRWERFGDHLSPLLKSLGPLADS